MAEAVTWPDAIDEVLGGDMVAALAYTTPAKGAVAMAVGPIGLRDREAGTVGFTTSLGFGRKLERMQRDPRIALAYHAREHGLAKGPNNRFVLVQGDAELQLEPDRDYLEHVIAPKAARFMGPPRRGAFWDRWMQAYYADRVVVTVKVRRIVSHAQLDAAGPREVLGEPMPAEPPPPQKPPAKGTGPRVDAVKAARRWRALDHQIVAFRGTDGYPVMLPFAVGEATEQGIVITTPAGLPLGGRRAGVLAHSFGPQMTGLAARQHTGWLEVSSPHRGVYAPHTETGFRAPRNKTAMLLANGLLAHWGLRRARRSGRLEQLRASSRTAP
jgi:hypothetical protein